MVFNKINFAIIPVTFTFEVHQNKTKMKQILTIAILSFTLFSCSKKDSVKNNELYGTKWSLRYDSQNFLTLHFADNQNFTLIGKNDGEANNFSGTYTYSKPTVSMKVIENGQPSLMMTGTVTGNVMKISFTEAGEYFEGNLTKE